MDFFPEDDTAESGIFFHTENIEFQLSYPELIQDWLHKIIEQEGGQLSLLNFIFCSDQYLLQINIEYLQHDTYTDIITFQYQQHPIIEGDIFISIDRIRENAARYDVSFDNELKRVLVHGVLHLCGYRDKTKEEKQQMRKKENEALAAF